MLFPKVSEIKEKGSIGIGIDFKFENGQHLIDKKGMAVECTARENLENWILKVVVTEVNAYEVYYRAESTAFGVSVYEHIGIKNRGYWLSELKREITTQLLENQFIEAVEEFKVEIKRRSCDISFKVISVDGVISFDTRDIVYCTYTDTEIIPATDNNELMSLLKFNSIIDNDIIGDYKEV